MHGRTQLSQSQSLTIMKMKSLVICWDAAMSYREKTQTSLSCEWEAALTVGEMRLWFFLRGTRLWMVERTRLWFVERNTLWFVERNAALNFWEKYGSELLRETRLWTVERNTSLNCLEVQAYVLQLDGEDAALCTSKRGLRNRMQFNMKISLGLSMQSWRWQLGTHALGFPGVKIHVSSRLDLIFA